MMYGNFEQLGKAGEIRLGLRVGLTDAINKIKAYKPSARNRDTLKFAFRSVGIHR